MSCQEFSHRQDANFSFNLSSHFTNPLAKKFRQPDLAGLVFSAGIILMIVGVVSAVRLFARRQKKAGEISKTAVSLK